MKSLIAGIVLLLVLGIGAFFYRNALEHPSMPPAAPVACTTEAKVCPDGTSVGRSGPTCAFAACPAPNVELPAAGIAFALPAGYEPLESGAAGQSTLAIYQLGTSTEATGVIAVKDFAIPTGKTALDVMTLETTKDPSGMHPKASEFVSTTIASRAFKMITVGRFEGQVETAYYLPRASDVLEFDLIEHGVNNWMDSKLDINALPQHQAFLKMLGTLQVQ